MPDPKRDPHMGFLLGMTQENGTSKQSKKVQIDPGDIVALGILVLTIAAAYIACVTVSGLIHGKVSENTAMWIIGTCVGAPSVSGLVAKLIGKSGTRR